MKTIMVSALLLIASSVSAQMVTSFTTTVNITGTGFSTGDIVVASPSGATCTSVTIVSATSITALCPDGTSQVSVKKKTTYPFVLKSSWIVPSTGAFTWTVGGAAPAAQTLSVFDSSPCPPVPPVPYCAWPGTTVTSDSPWLIVSPSSGTTEFNVTVSINTSALTVGSYTGHITLNQKLFTTPTLTVPVTLAVSGAVPPHTVTLNWNASTVPNGAPPVTGYNILRGTSNTGPFTQIGTTAATVLTYIDSTPPTGNVCYTVEGVNASGPSANATPVCVTVPSSALMRYIKSRKAGWGFALVILIGIISLLRKKISSFFGNIHHSHGT